MKRPWIRLYTEIVNDPKVCRLSDQLHRTWIGCLCIAADSDGFLPPDTDVAFALRLPEKTATSRLLSLVNAGLIDREGDAFRMHGWDNRQYESDSSTERAKRSKQRSRDKTGERSPQRCGIALEQSRADTEQRAEQSRADARPPDDTEQRIRKLADQQPNPQDFERGVNRAVQEVIGSGNPLVTIAAMESNLPRWWEAMREGRVKLKPLGYVIADGDYLRLPPALPNTLKRPDISRITEGL